MIKNNIKLPIKLHVALSHSPDDWQVIELFNVLYPRLHDTTAVSPTRVPLLDESVMLPFSTVAGPQSIIKDCYYNELSTLAS